MGDNKPFAQKHQGLTIDPELKKQIEAQAKNKIINCASAHKAASLAGVSPKTIGIQIDLMEYRLSRCQLGLFGYKDQKRLNPDIEISPSLSKKIDDVAPNGRISCEACWELADKENLSKLDMGSACEKKNMKIKPCQLGAF